MASTMILPPHHSWPIGFGFRPTEEELLSHYLRNKMLGHESDVQYIREIDLYNYEPWELPKLSFFKSDNYEWFFFRAQPSNARGCRTKRTTRSGYWKSTGEDRKIKARGTNEVIGSRKILVFHEGRSPSGSKTNWVIHEYHLELDTNNAYQRSFVISRLKENAEEKDASTRDQDEQKRHVASHLNKKVTERAVQEVCTDTFAHGQSTPQPVCREPQPPALPDFQPPNTYGGEVNGQPIQPGASENGFNLTEWLNSVFIDQDMADDATSKMCTNSYNDPDFLSPWFPKSEPALMDFQVANGNDGEENNQILQHGASESELNLTEYLNSALMEDEKCDEVTSHIDIEDMYNKEELESMVLELQYGGFSSETDNDAILDWQNNHIFQSYSHENTSYAMRNIPSIKESRRSPLTVKRLQYKDEKDIYDLYELQSGSSVVSGEGKVRQHAISTESESSVHVPRTFRAQYQPKPSDVVCHASVPKRVRLKREIRSKAISQDKAKENEKHIKVVSSPQLSSTDFNNGLKSEEAGNKGTDCWLSCCGSIDGTRNVFSYILTTKQIHHKSSPPLFYVAKAILGTLIFLMFVREMLLYAQW